jgi:hypothetical protein
MGSLSRAKRILPAEVQQDVWKGTDPPTPAWPIMCRLGAHAPLILKCDLSAKEGVRAAEFLRFLEISPFASGRRHSTLLVYLLCHELNVVDMRIVISRMEIAMNTTLCDDERDREPQPVGEILEELLSQYEARFPDIHINVVETAATAV